MPSYQDIETRLRVIEDVLGWLMNAMQIEQVIPTGMSGPDGRPTARVVRKRYIDLYREFKDASLAAIAEEAQRRRRDGEGDREAAGTTPSGDAEHGESEGDVPLNAGAPDGESFAQLRERLAAEGVTVRGLDNK